MSNSNGIFTGPVPPQLFHPASVVVVGASGDPSKLGARPLENLRKIGYPGRIYLVNPKGGEIGGLPCHTSVAALPETPDVALLMVPGIFAVRAAEECAERGVAVAVVASTGFAEAGGEGLRHQQALTDLARRGLRIVGPNTNGIYCAQDRLSLGYNSAHAEIHPAGPVSVVSHSGAVFNVIVERLKAQGLGLSKFIPVGNEADLDMLDFIEYLIGDPDTSVILLILEALRDGERFRALARRAAAAGKRMAAIKLGTSEAGSASTAAHSSRLAGNQRAYAALLNAAGVGCVHSFEGLVAFAQFALLVHSEWKPRQAPKMGIITASGAGGTVLADVGAEYGFGVADMCEETRNGLHRFGEQATIFNPMDVGNFGGSAKSQETAPLVSTDVNVDLVAVFSHTLQTPARRKSYASGVADGFKRSGKPHVVLAPGGLLELERDILRSGGIPAFTEAATMFDGLRALFAPGGEAYAPGSGPVVDTPSIAKAVASAAAGSMNEFASMALLDLAGIPTVGRNLVSTAHEAASDAAALGWPVVLKGVVDGLAHKSDVGLVHLDLKSSGEVTTAFAQLKKVLAGLPEENRQSSRICVQKMLRTELELLVGFTTEAPLGRFLLAGWGGRYAEDIDEVRLWAIPATEQEIRDGLAQTAAGRVMLGARWGRAESFDRVVEVLLRLQALALAAGPALRAAEINPLGVSRSGMAALDALIIVSDDTGGTA